MTEFPVQMLQQLPDYLRAFRRQAGLTQAQAAARLGVTQQVFSSLERHPEKVSVERLFKALQLLNVRMVLSSRSSSAGEDKAASHAPLLW